MLPEECADTGENNDGDVVEITSAREIVSANEGGLRVAQGSDGEDEAPQRVAGKARRKKAAPDFNSREAKYLSLFVSGKRCLSKIWDQFFENGKKSKRNICAIGYQYSH